MCVVKTASYRRAFLGLKNPSCVLSCPLCKQLTIPYSKESHQRAFEYQVQLLESFNSRNDPSSSTRKCTSRRGVTIPSMSRIMKYAFYRELHKEINMKEAPMEFSSFITPIDKYDFSEHTEDMCLLLMSRMERERQLRRDQGVNSDKGTFDLPLGPLNRLDIPANVFLEAYLTIVAETTRNSGLELEFVSNATVIPKDPLAVINESAGGAVTRAVAMGGELPVSAVQEILSLQLLRLDEDSRAPEEEDPSELAFVKMCSREFTPCPYCNCDPSCSTYLASHMAHFHPSKGQMSHAPDGKHSALFTEASLCLDAAAADGSCHITVEDEDASRVLDTICSSGNSTSDDDVDLETREEATKELPFPETVDMV